MFGYGGVEIAAIVAGGGVVISAILFVVVVGGLHELNGAARDWVYVHAGSLIRVIDGPRGVVGV
eukprot:16394384-Heterocapsa_arctica.AAC.1